MLPNFKLTVKVKPEKMMKLSRKAIELLIEEHDVEDEDGSDSSGSDEECCGDESGSDEPSGVSDNESNSDGSESDTASSDGERAAGKRKAAAGTNTKTGRKAKARQVIRIGDTEVSGDLSGMFDDAASAEPTVVKIEDAPDAPGTSDAAHTPPRTPPAAPRRQSVRAGKPKVRA